MAKKQHLPISGRTSDGQAVTISESEVQFLTQIAGWGEFEKAGNDALKAKGLSLPSDYRLPAKHNSTSIWRIAPDRALIRSNAALDIDATPELVVLDLSHARICIHIEGQGAAGLLSRVVALDFSEAGFPSGSFAQTALHHIGVLIERQERDEFSVLIPTTWATSLISLLSDHLHRAA